MLPSMPDNRALVRNFVASGYNLKESEVHRTASDGSEKYFLLNLIGIVENSALGELWGTQRDVTRRRLDEIRIKDSETKYRTIFEGSQDAIFVSTTGGRILDVNRAALELFGSPSVTHILSIPSIDVFFGVPAQLQEYHRQLLQDGSIREFEFELRRVGGHPSVLVSASAETDLVGGRSPTAAS